MGGGKSAPRWGSYSMNILDIRVQIETTLADVLGTYRLANGASTPAIAVRAAGESHPPGTTVTGVEVVIVRDPEPITVVQYQHQAVGARWTIYLVDWEGFASLQTIAGRLIWAYPGTTATLISVPKGVGPQAQMRVTLQTNPAS